MSSPLVRRIAETVGGSTETVSDVVDGKAVKKGIMQAASIAPVLGN